MKTGERRVGPASLRVRQCTALPLHLREHTREIVNLETPFDQQNRGYAATLMRKVCREADKCGITLVLTPAPYGDNLNLSAQQLEEWYQREFGFYAVQREPTVFMARLVNSTPTRMRLNPATEAIIKDFK